MADATEFGKELKSVMGRNDINQAELAKKIEVSPSILSNYIIGKNIPEMEFLDKCISVFGQKQKGKKEGVDIVDFFFTNFISSAMSNHHKVIFDTKNLDSRRLKMLAKILTVLILYPEITINSNYDPIVSLEDSISKYFNELEKNAKYNPPDG